jgi:hypothetical protein
VEYWPVAQLAEDEVFIVVQLARLHWVETAGSIARDAFFCFILVLPELWISRLFFRGGVGV